MRSLFIAVVFGLATSAFADDLSLDQQLIVSCHRLDVEKVVIAIREGADVNARFGKGDVMVFLDPWSHGWPGAGESWTPLIAVANSSDYPHPPGKIENNEAGWKLARKLQFETPSHVLEQRRRDAIAILFILLSHHADIDAEDEFGNTALYEAIGNKKEELAKSLLQFNPNVNTKNRLFCGVAHETPLHRAYWSADLRKLLLEKGADPNAKDTMGHTPKDWEDSLAK